jgi:hypothetical protein
MQILKKRILVPIVGQGSITHIIRTGMLVKMSEFCKPVIALMWKEEELIKELQAKGYEVTFFPAYKVSPAYASLRYKINLWYLHHKLKTPSVNIQKKYLAQFKKNQKTIQFKKQLRETYHKIRFKVQSGYINELLQQEVALMQQEQVFVEYKNWLKSLDLSGLFTVTPFLHEVDLIARIFKQQNLPVIASIHSFDNVTKRGWQSVVFDRYIVWNKYNKAELQRIYKDLQKDELVTIAGAPQFDFHYNKEFAWSRQEWLQRVGLPADKKIILFSGGPVSLLPNEPQYLLALKEAFETGLISKDYIVLFRCHPLDKVERWKQYVGECPFIVYDSAPNGTTKLDYVNVLKEDIMNLMSTLKHTDIHINTISTMCVDGSAFQKPQIGPFYDDINPSGQELFRQMYYQEHYVPIMKSNVLNLAYTKTQFIDLVNQLIKNPSAYTANCKNCVEEIITYSDGKSTSRAVSAIKNFFAA